MPLTISNIIAASFATGLILSADAALGCPMCKQAAADDPGMTRAFMTSILFMMSMPFMLVAGFGFAFWRLSKRNPDESEE